jgi:hypothetical protein
MNREEFGKFVFRRVLRFFVVILKKVQEEWFDSDGTLHRRVVCTGFFLNWKRWPKSISKKFLARFIFAPLCQALLPCPLGL